MLYLWGSAITIIIARIPESELEYRGFPANTISAGDYTIISAEKRGGEIILFLENENGEVRLYALPEKDFIETSDFLKTGIVWVSNIRGVETIKMYVKIP